MYPQPAALAELTKAANASLRKWADRFAPAGFGWTSLQINMNTSSEWHYDHKNEGPSALMVVGRHSGGEFEGWGYEPAKLDNQVIVIDGRQWHRNHAPWDGTRISFAAFTSMDYKRANLEHVRNLHQLGFRLPTAEFLRDWRGSVGGVRGETVSQVPETKDGGPDGLCVTAYSGPQGLRVAAPAPDPESTEPVRKGAQTSYKARGKK